MIDSKYVEPKLTSYLFAKASRNHVPICGTFELSPVCNFDCKMCYVHMTPQQVKDTGRKMMEYDDWITLAKQAKDEGMLYLLLTGGEPFLYPDFRKLFEELSKMGFVISINSNGSLIDENTVEWLKTNTPMRINITLYGASNETYYQLTGDKYGFDKVAKAIDRLKEAHIPVKLNCSLTPYNVKDLEKMIEFAKERNLIIEVATYMFPAIRRSKNNIGKNNRFTAKEMAHYSLKTYKLQYGNDAFIKYVKDVLEGIVPCINEECLEVTAEGNVRCRAGKAMFWATWDGRILPCGMMVTPEVSLNGRTFHEAWKKIVKKTSEIKLSGTCSNCKNQNICHVCAAMTYAETGDFKKTPKYLCQLVNALHNEALSILDKNNKDVKEEN